MTLWSPVARSDIAWNFEKFLIGKDGQIIERFSRYYPTADIKEWIKKQPHLNGNVCTGS